MKRVSPLVILFIFALWSIVMMDTVESLPAGPNVTYNTNTTATAQAGATVNTSGGSITTMVLNATTQNVRWKAFVGNVTGTLSLEDGEGYSVFDWSVTELVGEVYSTRKTTSVTWGAINCSTTANITAEEVAINHTSNPNDNISRTFNTQVHDGFYVGSTEIVSNSCYSLHTHINDTAQSAEFEEILLHDDTNVVYATILENNQAGYRPDASYDFQMIVPERGHDGWTSSTPYYFYVELI